MECSLGQSEETDVDDEALVRAAKENRAAFAPIYQKYVARVYRYVFRRIGSANEAEDITAQVFEDALHSLPRYHPQGRFAGWLFGIAYRRCADYYRHPPTTAMQEEIPSRAADPVEYVIDQETHADLERLLSRLREEDRELLRLRFAAQLTYAEMADVLHRNEGAVKVAMSRLLQKLNAQWEVENERKSAR